MSGITVTVLGDSGPFSRTAKSIGYMLEIGGRRYLIDCGAPIFQQIGGHGLKEIDGLIITHCHDDHKRWFGDLVLFNMYATDAANKVCLMTSEDVHEDIIRASMPALGKSLSSDSMRVVDHSYDEYVDYRMIGPRARYRIVSVDGGGGRSHLSVVDNRGNTVGPERAKIFLHPKTKIPRMLFKDPDYNEWVEPESFYAFSSNVFYEENKNIFQGDGFTVEALKAHVWHSVAGIGLRVKTPEETLVFSSDTAHDRELWKDLCSCRRPDKTRPAGKDFEAAPVIDGDINDYIERCWSEGRYRDATETFREAVVVHDIAGPNSVVHTDYDKLDRTVLDKGMTLLTHSPDRITSEWALCDTNKVFRIEGGRFFEVAGEKLYPMDADIYHKEKGRYYAGYKNEKGKYLVYERNGLLGIASSVDVQPGKPLFRVDLYEDIDGMYFPRLEDERSFYLRRKDGRVELVELTGEGSRGRVVKDHRPRLSSTQKETREEVPPRS